MRPRHSLLVLVLAGSLSAPDDEALAADLQRLVGYTPAAAAPTDAAVLAAEPALAKAMPKLVRRGGPVADALQRLFAGRAARLLPTRQTPIREVDPLARTLVRFTGTGEVTVNLFSLYLCETLGGKPWHDAWGGNLGRAKPRLAKVLADGHLPWGSDDPGAGKADLSLRLPLYSQLQQQFGWEAFQRCFAGYRDLPAAERPKDEAHKRDQWLVRFSRTVGRDLGDYFAAWGVPTGDAARASLADLPKWMPADWPAAK